MYTAERASTDNQRHYYDRARVDFDAEVIFTPPVGPPRLVCICSYADAHRIAAALNGRYTVRMSADGED